MYNYVVIILSLDFFVMMIDTRQIVCLVQETLTTGSCEEAVTCLPS